MSILQHVVDDFLGHGRVENELAELCAQEGLEAVEVKPVAAGEALGARFGDELEALRLFDLERRGVKGVEKQLELALGDAAVVRGRVDALKRGARKQVGEGPRLVEDGLRAWLIKTSAEKRTQNCA